MTDNYCVHREVVWIFNYGAAAGEDELRILVFDFLFGERDFRDPSAGVCTIGRGQKTPPHGI